MILFLLMGHLETEYYIIIFKINSSKSLQTQTYNISTMVGAILLLHLHGWDPLDQNVSQRTSYIIKIHVHDDVSVNETPLLFLSM